VTTHGPGKSRNTTDRTAQAAFRFFTLFLFTLSPLLFLPACAPNPYPTAPDEPKPVPVTVAEAKPMALRRTVPVVGTLYPYEDVTLAPKVGGKVLRVFRTWVIGSARRVALELTPPNSGSRWIRRAPRSRPNSAN